MTWASKEEEAMEISGKHMSIMRLKKKKELSEIYSKLIFPRQGQNWMDVKWTTHWGVTFVTMWDEEHLLKNIQYAMLLEMMGLGPMKYYIVFNEMPNFFSKLLLLFLYLPYRMMYFYPPQFFFNAPFDHSPWMEIEDAICSRRFYLNSSIFCTVYYTQKFVVFQRIGVYGLAISSKREMGNKKQF